ncbi:MAG: diguanylate cyclase [Candidatus Liptonbacteria bacterium]|nr:diguanylate cyclase [Candidatus Liptonbacteria bacterium]
MPDPKFPDPTKTPAAQIERLQATVQLLKEARDNLVRENLELSDRLRALEEHYRQELAATQETIKKMAEEGTIGLGAMGELVRRLQEEISTIESDLQVAKYEARTDPATGLLNRRGLGERFEIALARLEHGRDRGSVRRAGDQPVKYTALALDMDNLKIFNDLWSHKVGDMVLMAATQYLRANIRHNKDVAGRMGGEEFCVLFESPLENIRDKFLQTDSAGEPCMKMSFSVRISPRAAKEFGKSAGTAEIIEPYEKPDLPVEIVYYVDDPAEEEKKEHPFVTGVTFSGGLTELDPDDFNIDGPYGRADIAASMAKGVGKNRILIYKPGMVKVKTEGNGR